jgi:hypothetical protein
LAVTIKLVRASKRHCGQRIGDHRQQRDRRQSDAHHGRGHGDQASGHAQADVPCRGGGPVGPTPERLELGLAPGLAQLAGQPRGGSSLGVGPGAAAVKVGQGRDRVGGAHQPG